MAYAADGNMEFEVAITIVLESSSMASGIISIFVWFILRNVCNGDSLDKECCCLCKQLFADGVAMALLVFLLL
jgi:hypothetical protein